MQTRAIHPSQLKVMARRICRAAVLGANPAGETASLENVLDLTRRICARLGKEPDVNLVELIPSLIDQNP